MQAEFMRKDGEPEPVGSAVWIGPEVRIDAGDEAVRTVLGRVFRPVPLNVDDPALRSSGTSGPVQVPPGTLRWFLQAARVRGGEEGLLVRFVPSSVAGGWDPAGTYRPLEAQTERLARVGAEASLLEQPGSARAEGERGPDHAGSEAARPGSAPSAAGTGEGERTPA